jgi:hypothetical protein
MKCFKVNSDSIFFIRHSKLLLPYKSHDEMPFGVMVDLASEKLNPSIDRKFTQPLIEEISKIIPFSQIDRIFVSPSKRCQETAILIQNFIKQNFQKDIIINFSSELQEIRFNLERIYIATFTDHVDIERINDSVFKAMISGKNCEHTFNSYKRVERFFKALRGNEKILIITHDFFMRVVEVYIKNHGKSDLSITYDDIKNTKRNLYLHGFATNLSLSEFVPF